MKIQMYHFHKIYSKVAQNEDAQLKILNISNNWLTEVTYLKIKWYLDWVEIHCSIV